MQEQPEQTYEVIEEGWTGLGYMQPMSCLRCGLVLSATGTCGYCGSKCE